MGKPTLALSLSLIPIPSPIPSPTISLTLTPTLTLHNPNQVLVGKRAEANATALEEALGLYDLIVRHEPANVRAP